MPEEKTVTTRTGERRRPASGRWVRRLLKLGVVAAVIGGVMLFVDPNEVLAVLASIPTTTILAVIGLLSLDRVLMGVKWRHLVVNAGTPLPLTRAVAIYYQSKFATLVFPAAFGGEIVRGLMGKKAGIPGPTLIASMVVERVVAAVSWLLFAGVAFSYLSTMPDHPRIGRMTTLVIAIAGACLAALAVVALHRPSHKLVGRFLRGWVTDRVYRILDRLSVATVQYRRVPRVLFVNLLLTMVEHTVQMVALYVLAMGMGFTLPAPYFFAATALIMLVRRGAGFLEGWGIAESGVVMLYTLFGVSASRSAALTLALWAASLVTCLPGGYLLAREAWRGVRLPIRATRRTLLDADGPDRGTSPAADAAAPHDADP